MRGPPAWLQPIVTVAVLLALQAAAPLLQVDLDHASAQGVRGARAVAPVTTSELVGVRGLSGLTLSPDGRSVAFRVEEQRLDANATDLSWHVVSLDDVVDTRVGSAGEPVWGYTGGLEMEQPQWSPDGRWLYYRAVVSQEAQVWRAFRDGSLQEQLTHDAADVRAFTVDGAALVYATAGAAREEILAAEELEYNRGVLLDDTLLTGYPVVRTIPINGRMATARNLKTARGATLLGDRPTQIRVLDLASRETATAGPDAVERYRPTGGGMAKFYEGGRGFGPVAPGSPGALSQDGKRIAEIVTRRAAPQGAVGASRSGAYLVWRADAASSSETACSDPVCLDADAVAVLGWGPEHQTVVFQTVNFGAEGLHVWDTRRNRVLTLLKIDGVLGSQSSGARGACRMAGREAICIQSGPALAPRLVSIDLGSGAQRVLLNPNPGLTPDRLGAVEKLTIADRSGTTTQGWLVLPRDRKAGERLPLVITSYTCSGFLVGGSGGDVPEHVLAGRGYAAVCLDTGHNSARFGPGIRNITYRDTLDMFIAIVDQLDRRGIVDPDRVAISGFSASATSVSYAIAASGRFAAAIMTTQGYLDPIDTYLRGATGEHRRDFQARNLSLPYDSTENHPDSPALNAIKITTPLLMQLGEVEYPAMTQLHTALNDYGRAVEMWIFPDAYHIKNQPRQRLAVYDRNVDWLDFWLLGRENPDIVDLDRYARWQAMREKLCRIWASDDEASRRASYC